ncbi:T6SS phospholipase effector Tle1-like catalytic domain-containing protein [Marinobacter arenosus]|uniref:T6SS phospholipase effector Tle1-like catalytic domain-containing protein n=1 Tax=Marinobacter arenosus TaxID=2856822 RepID=UPI001C4BDECD|nr:DUF2235 domain-containing protein [Marinobacter arenosus]MBW0146905.1 DUF2235 domain-containing protein [Marinobacter arenosus]
MLIKPRSRLTARDLPFVESPHLAARRVKQALDSGASPELRFDPSEIPGVPIYSSPDTTRAGLLSALEAGQVMLVLDPGTSHGAINPPVRWRPESSISAGGRWVSDYASMPFPLLSQELDRLNRLGETPESLASSGAVGLMPKQTGQRAGATDAEEASGPTDRKLSLPLGAAAGIAPLAEPAPRAPETQADDTDLPVHLTIGIFLDGTLNNASNVELFKQRVERECLAPLRDDPTRLEDCQKRLRLLMGESYANAPTNIFKLWRLYRERDKVGRGRREVGFSVYQPGVGTETGQPDSLISMATGMGETGILDQTEKASEEIASQIEGLAGSGEVKKFTFDIFGFSRGAAAARHMANDLLRGSEGVFFRKLSERGITWKGEVRIRFMGLFDTVPGVVNLKQFDLHAGDDRYEPIQLYLDPGQVEEVVHLTATDERRENFSLVSVADKDKKLPPNFTEVSMPGAHSDIGGGYSELQVEEVLLHPPLSIRGSQANWHRNTMEWDNLVQIREEILAEGWIGDHSLRIPDGGPPDLWISEDRSEHPAPDGRVELSLRMKRHIRGDYSLVALRLMHNLSRDAGVPLDLIDEQDGQLALSDHLKAVFGHVCEQVSNGRTQIKLDSQQTSLLKQRYVHYSDHYNLLEVLFRDEIFRLEIPFEFLLPSRPSRTRERSIYPNRKAE